MAPTGQHLSDQDLEKYRRRRMAPAELLASDDHLSECDDCYGRLGRIEDLRSSLASALAALSESGGAGAAHLTYDELARYLDGESPATERATSQAHLEVCPECERELDDLRAFKGRLAGSPASRAAEAQPSRARGW